MRLFRKLIHNARVKGSMICLCCHLNELLREDQLSLYKKINYIIYTIATEALMGGASESFVSSKFPFEDVRMVIGGKKQIVL